MELVALLSDPAAWLALITLVALEIVLGIDNVVFIAILCSRLPADQQPLGRRLGLAAALVTRIMLLCLLFWMLDPNNSFFTHALVNLTEDIGLPEEWLLDGQGLLQENGELWRVSIDGKREKIEIGE